jgi:uncharacterized membrane protein
MDLFISLVKRGEFRVRQLLLAFLLCLLFSAGPLFPSLGVEGAVVRAVIFYSPSCPHCHTVIEEFLVPLFDQYGEQIEMVGVDTSSPGGSALFSAAIQHFAIPPEQQVVPMLIVGETILLGSYDIPDQFPGLIEHYLDQGGVDWPDIPGLREALAEAAPGPTPVPEPTLTSDTTAVVEDRGTTSAQASQPQPSPSPLASGLILPDSSSPGLAERLARDPAGNFLAILVLIGMIFSLFGIIKVLSPVKGRYKFYRPSLWIALLCLVGGVVAAYLAYVETAQVEAVCGPVGDCNTVQQSQYAHLFGVLPIGVLGLLGYIAMLGAWLLGRYGTKRLARLASIALLGMSTFGVLFSIYLTFLEPFVIGATCAWCLSSAVIMTALMWLSVYTLKPASRGFAARSLPKARKAA